MKIRAHHLLCLLGFVGMGYSSKFVEKIKEIKKKVENEPDELI